MTKLRLMDCSDDELAAALHMLEGHEDGFEGSEARAWQLIKGMVLDQVENARELEVDNDNAEFQGRLEAAEVARLAGVKKPQ